LLTSATIHLSQILMP